MKKKVNRQLSTKVDRSQVALACNLMWCLRGNLLSYSIGFQLYYFQPNLLIFFFCDDHYFWDYYNFFKKQSICEA